MKYNLNMKTCLLMNGYYRAHAVTYANVCALHMVYNSVKQESVETALTWREMLISSNQNTASVVRRQPV